MYTDINKYLGAACCCVNWMSNDIHTRSRPM